MAFGTNVLRVRSGDDASAPLRADNIEMPGNDDYLTGGNTGLTDAIKSILGITPTIVDVTGLDATGRYSFQWDAANAKLKIIDLNPTPPAEVAPGDKSAIVFWATVISK